MTKVDENLYVEDGDDGDVFEDVSYGVSSGEIENNESGAIDTEDEND